MPRAKKEEVKAEEITAKVKPDPEEVVVVTVLGDRDDNDPKIVGADVDQVIFKRNVPTPCKRKHVWILEQSRIRHTVQEMNPPAETEPKPADASGGE